MLGTPWISELNNNYANNFQILAWKQYIYDSWWRLFWSSCDHTPVSLQCLNLFIIGTFRLELLAPLNWIIDWQTWTTMKQWFLLQCPRIKSIILWLQLAMVGWLGETWFHRSWHCSLCRTAPAERQIAADHSVSIVSMQRWNVELFKHFWEFNFIKC